MTDMPKTSIIVPVYKAEKYLRRCIESIVLQTYTDWELLLVDDGSPDGSGGICGFFIRKTAASVQRATWAWRTYMENM